MKKYVVAFVSSVLVFAGLACSNRSARQTTPDRAFYDVCEGSAREVSDVIGVKEDRTSYIIAQGGVKIEAACTIRYGAVFTTDGTLCKDAAPFADSTAEPVRDSLGRIIEDGKGEYYAYSGQELRPALDWDAYSLEHYIYKGLSFSPSELYYFDSLQTDGAKAALTVWHKQYRYIEKDSHGNWTKRKALVTTGSISGAAKDYYSPLLHHDLPMDTRIQLEKELCLELENKSNRDIETGYFADTESRDIRYYER